LKIDQTSPTVADPVPWLAVQTWLLNDVPGHAACCGGIPSTGDLPRSGCGRLCRIDYLGQVWRDTVVAMEGKCYMDKYTRKRAPKFEGMEEALAAAVVDDDEDEEEAPKKGAKNWGAVEQVAQWITSLVIFGVAQPPEDSSGELPVMRYLRKQILTDDARWNGVQEANFLDCKARDILATQLAKPTVTSGLKSSCINRIITVGGFDVYNAAVQSAFAGCNVVTASSDSKEVKYESKGAVPSTGLLPKCPNTKDDKNRRWWRRHDHSKLAWITSESAIALNQKMVCAGDLNRHGGSKSTGKWWAGNHYRGGGAICWQSVPLRKLFELLANDRVYQCEFSEDGEGDDDGYIVSLPKKVNDGGSDLTIFRLPPPTGTCLHLLLLSWEPWKFFFYFIDHNTHPDHARINEPGIDLTFLNDVSNYWCLL
jgi:hypothetical protein